MAYFDVCPVCGANLDPGEECDCEKSLQAGKEFEKEAEKKTPTEIAVSVGAKGAREDISITISLYHN